MRAYNPKHKPERKYAEASRDLDIDYYREIYRQTFRSFSGSPLRLPRHLAQKIAYRFVENAKRGLAIASRL